MVLSCARINIITEMCMKRPRAVCCLSAVALSLCSLLPVLVAQHCSQLRALALCGSAQQDCSGERCGALPAPPSCPTALAWLYREAVPSSHLAVFFFLFVTLFSDYQRHLVLLM